ncbi:MAG: serine peptidase [Methylothermaceae bacteria B42]|nr:MAG: serine peptidase [Methylothermaceae bacteria B42]HHJ39670.1 DegQ family serine endoprotease [Methylothermaceae bacterium]
MFQNTKFVIKAVWIWVFWLGLSQAWAGELPDFTELVEKTSPSVVNISTTRTVESQPVPELPEGMEIPEGSPLEDLFKHFFGQQGPLGPREARSLGSGFIISSDGYIVTNHHVVKDADEIIVRMQDRRELVAKLIGTDKSSDLALLKIDAEDLPVVTMGSSRDLKVGEWVVAIGSPFGFDQSVTAGIVSAKGRSLPGDNYVPFIQTDVAINPGNSGGPLFNMDGEVVGVNSQIYSRTGGFMGLSFAIPIDVALEVVEQLKTKGHVSRGWLGVQIQDVTRELAESFGMDRPRGALIAQVLEDSPAAKAGFEVGSVIIEYNGHPIETAGALPPLVGMTPPGTEVSVKVLQDGKIKTLTVRIGQLPKEQQEGALSVHPLEPGSVKVPQFGLIVADLSPQERKRRGVKSGVIVRRVLAGAAREAGIRPGDIIVRIGDQPVTSAKALKKRAASLAKGKPIAVLVKRGDGSLFLAIKPGANKPKQ